MSSSPRDDDTNSPRDALGPIYQLNERHAYFSRTLDDGRVLDVIPLTFGRARIVISRDENATDYLDGW